MAFIAGIIKDIRQRLELKILEEEFLIYGPNRLAFSRKDSNIGRK